jgi:hypothetical protein
MNNPSTVNTATIARPDTHLLDRITAIQESVGDGLNDDELTRLLERTALPDEAGFAFLSFSDRFATLSVPPQDLANWYPERGWIVAEKESIARAIAAKYELVLCEPPDAPHACFDAPNPHHHLELGNRRETIVVIHPQYLKVRLFGAIDATRYAQAGQRPLSLGPDLLQDLSTLY